MRLLNTKTLSLEEFYEDFPDYAVLSHRWGDGEVAYQDLFADHKVNKKGWSKIVACCRMAASRGLPYAWIDTCCIDKSSSAELAESINSMYAWYEQATECYALLSDVHGSPKVSASTVLAKEIRNSVWFTRGWTLQELIAPSKVIFFNSEWERLWTKSSHSRELQEITHIHRRLLEGESSLSEYSLAQRMAWSATRTTTRPEDEAYCLLGIFQVNLPMLYGEGRNAFRRLQEEIIKQSDDQTLFAWHDDREMKPVLAPSVSCFKDLHDLRCIYATNDSRFGHTLSNSGVNIKLMLIPWAMNIYVAPLSCGRALARNRNIDEPSARGYSRMAIFLRQTKFEDHLIRVKVDGKDFVMLDSDVVAYKRDSFGIKDRQVFVRQSLVELPDEIYHSFAFNYLRPRMFSSGQLPTPGIDILNVFDRNASNPNTRDHIYEPYGHYESVAFDISHLTVTKRPYYLHLGFDTDFFPVCLITKESWQVGKNGRDCQHDFEGMYSLRSRQVSSLSWLLSQIRAGKTSTSILTFKVAARTLTEVRCQPLSLKIKFEIRKTAHEIEGLGFHGNMWHVTFEHFPIIPTTPSAYSSSHVLPQTAAHEKSEDRQPHTRERRRSQWLNLFTFKKAKLPKSSLDPDGLDIDFPVRAGVPSMTLQAIDGSRASQMTTVPEFSRYSAMTQVPHSSMSPGEMVRDERPISITPFVPLEIPASIPSSSFSGAAWAGENESDKLRDSTATNKPLTDSARFSTEDTVGRNSPVQGAALEVVDDNGWTLLHYWAAGVDRNDKSWGIGPNIMGHETPEGIDINTADWNGNTPLHIACSVHAQTAVLKLLRKGAKPDIRNVHGDQPLHSTLTEDYRNGLDQIRRNRHMDPDERPRILGILNLLLLYGADVNATGEFEQTALHRAVDSMASSSLCEWLLDRGATSEAVDSNGDTPLTRACLQGDVGSCFGVLWDCGVDMQRYQHRLRQGFDNALAREDWVLANDMLRCGLTTAANETTVKGIDIHHCARRNHSFLLDWALKQQVFDLEEANAFNLTPLGEAVDRKRLESVHVLLKHGADPNAVGPCPCGDDTHDATVLRIAAGKGYTDILVALLAAGADPNTRNYKNNTALSFAAESNHVGCLRALLDVANIEVNVVDTDGDSALICAVLGDNLETTKLLLARKDVDRSIRNNKGFTAEEIALTKSGRLAALFSEDKTMS